MNVNSFPNGKYVHDMAVAFYRKGFKVHVVTHNYNDSKSYEVKDGVQIHRFNYFIKKWEYLTRGSSGIPENMRDVRSILLIPVYFLIMFIKALYIINKYKISIINAHWAVPTGFIAVFIRMFTGGKLITTVYGAELFPAEKGKLKILKPFIRYALQRADVVAGISGATVKSAKAISSRTDIKIIPDGIDIIKYRPGERNGKLLSKYGVKTNEKAIFFTGNMIERKGHVHLLLAMKVLVKRHSNIKLILGGRGPLYNHIYNTRSSLELEDVVVMPGFIDDKDIIPLLQSVDIYVLPSCIDKRGDTEGSATAALEAMACGTPAVISKVGGNIGAINDGTGAYYFQPENSKEMAEIEFLPMQPGDIPESYAGIKKSQNLLGFNPTTNIDFGIGKFIHWFKEYNDYE